jgi:hypothetical protein
VSLSLTNNSKTKFSKNHYNTFGLNFGLPENGGTCPRATSGPGGCLGLKTEDGKVATCYMAKLVKAWKTVREALQRNTDLLLGKTEDEMVTLLLDMVDRFVKQHAQGNPCFRLHYSGDFFSPEYAAAWRTVVQARPLVKFWVYSRCFEYAPLFAGQANVTFFLSVDPVNYEEGKRVHAGLLAFSNIGMAWMGNQPPTGEYRWVVCPETSGRLPNKADRGACGSCRLCVDRYRSKVRNVSFQIH